MRPFSKPMPMTGKLWRQNGRCSYEKLTTHMILNAPQFNIRKASHYRHLVWGEAHPLALVLVGKVAVLCFRRERPTALGQKDDLPCRARLQMKGGPVIRGALLCIIYLDIRSEFFKRFSYLHKKRGWTFLTHPAFN